MTSRLAEDGVKGAALLGQDIHGHVVAHLSGHALNAALVRTLLATATALLASAAGAPALAQDIKPRLIRFGYGLNDLQWFAINAMKSAFLPFDERLTIITEQIKPQYSALRAVLAERLTERS